MLRTMNIRYYNNVKHVRNITIPLIIIVCTYCVYIIKSMQRG